MNTILSSQVDDFYDQVFTNIVYRSKRIDFKEFYDCVFENCTFHEVDFSGCRFVNCTFDGCDISLAKVHNASYRSTTFKNSKMIGIDWSVASSPLMADFFDCDISYSSFAHVDFTKRKIIRCKAQEVYFWEANLTQANLSETDFENSQFKECNLTQADFSTARNYAINPSLNTLKEAKFSLPEAVSLLYLLDIVLVE
jgi:fluoroquinolone resistance protein